MICLLRKRVDAAVTVMAMWGKGTSKIWSAFGASGSQLRSCAATNWFPIGKKFAEMGLKGRKMAENGHEMIDDGGPLVMM